MMNTLPQNHSATKTGGEDLMKKLKSISKDLKFMIPPNRYEQHRKHCEKENQKTAKQWQRRSSQFETLPEQPMKANYATQLRPTSPYLSSIVDQGRNSNTSQQFRTQAMGGTRKSFQTVPVNEQVNISLGTVHYQSTSKPSQKEPIKTHHQEPVPS